jgi:hypothetical protein
MENMKSIIFGHWGHRGWPLEAKVSKTKSIIDDLNFHVFKSAAPQLSQKLLAERSWETWNQSFSVAGDTVDDLSKQRWASLNRPLTIWIFMFSNRQRPGYPKGCLQSDHGKHEINHFRSLGTPWMTSRSKGEQD